MGQTHVSGYGKFVGAPDMETAARTTGLLVTAGRNLGDSERNPFAAPWQDPRPFPTRAVRYSATYTGAAGSQGTPTSPAQATN